MSLSKGEPTDMVEFIKSYGGRENYYPVKYKKDRVGDCVIRAIAHGTGQDYLVVYKDLFELAMSEGDMPNSKVIYNAYLSSLGWKKNSPAKNARGKKIRLKDWEIEGTCIILTSGHLTCIKDGVLYDVWDCRPWCGNSYWTPPRQEK